MEGISTSHTEKGTVHERQLRICERVGSIRFFALFQNDDRREWENPPIPCKQVDWLEEASLLFVPTRGEVSAWSAVRALSNLRWTCGGRAGGRAGGRTVEVQWQRSGSAVGQSAGFSETVTESIYLQ